MPQEGCSQASLADADTIAELCRELLDDGARVTDDEGTVRLLVPPASSSSRPTTSPGAASRSRSRPASASARSTKFQGQEAPVVFFAMTCSSGEDVPRGLSFRFDRNRFNVAITRAQCLAVLVHAPRLLDADCRSLEHKALVDRACRFAELAMPVAGQ